MVPILSGLIIKSNNISSRKPFLLSMYYVLGLCLLYLLVGLFIGYSTNIYNIQSAFQEPLYLVIFSFILILLSFSMFGFYEIKISNSFQKFITDISNKINIGGYRGSFIMGFLSALIVGPCVAPPLAGIFIYITSENPGSLWTGILFLSLAIGMSIPLLAYGTFIGRIIPKTGQWMRYINYFIGILLLITAIFFIDRLIPILNVNKQDPELVFNKISNVKEFNNILSSTKKTKGRSGCRGPFAPPGTFGWVSESCVRALPEAPETPLEHQRPQTEVSVPDPVALPVLRHIPPGQV